jgi:hypothetical protein
MITMIDVARAPPERQRIGVPETETGDGHLTRESVPHQVPSTK